MFENLRKLGSSWLPLVNDRLLVHYVRFVVDEMATCRRLITDKAEHMSKGLDGDGPDPYSLDDYVELLELDREHSSYKCIIDVLISECVGRNLLKALESYGIFNIKLL